MRELLIWINYSAIVLSFAAALNSPEVRGHSGGMDAQGCHTDSSTGIRHCHVSPKPQVLWGEIYKVSDGDSVGAMVDGKRIKLRMSSIDAPEKRQRHGPEAKQALETMILGKSVRIVVLDRDRYKRHVVRLFVDGTNVNQRMVSSGNAWVYRRYLRDKALPGLQAEAQAARRGLWRDPSPVPPWEWRKRR